VDLEQTWADHLMHLELLAMLQAKAISCGRRQRLWRAPSDSLDDRITSPGASNDLDRHTSVSQAAYVSSVERVEMCQIKKVLD
jgi:hypothetical protein